MSSAAQTLPAGLRLHASNQLEVLAAQLAERMRVEPSDPLTPERIVVPHPALGRWLRLALASELGVAANLRIELPAEFAWAAMREAVPTLAKAQPFAPSSLRWRIHERLRNWPGDDALARYLQAEAADASDAKPSPTTPGERRRYELAERLAQVYDRCLLYRPDWIRAWQRGETPHWQAQLWQQLATDVASPAHWVDAIDAYREAVGAGRSAGSFRIEESTASVHEQEQLALPIAPPPPRARVSFFGIVVLSPSYLEMLRCATARMDVHLYLLSPCREFWADTRSARERPTTGEAHFDEGNGLLALWGRPARDMQALLAEDLGVGRPSERYQDTGASTRLAAVQRDILELRDAADGAEAEAPTSDDSLQVHICHSAMREAEVLHDRLLGVFDAHPDIEPADVLILTPSLDDYAGAVESVFAAIGTIPVNVGRRRRRDNAAVKALLDILALPGSRYAAPAVLAPLRARSVQLRFGIDEDDLPMLRDALHDAGIRWGIDAAHLGNLAMPTTTSHTWRDGARRLLLGYAVAEDATMIQGVVARPLRRGGFDASSGDYERLGGLLRYVEQLFALAAWSDQERAPEDWAAALREIVGGFYADLPGLAEVDAVASLIDEFEEECRVADCTAPISFEALRAAIAGLGEGATRSSARLADGATLGQLATGQIFPAKVVCVVGMNDRAFPRHPAQASFDLVADDTRRIGDRDVRDEDRFAFLEALLAARRSFIVTYTGRDMRDDAVMPPSVVVNELSEYLAERFPKEPSAGEREGLAPRMKEPSAGEREGLAPRMNKPSAAAAIASDPAETAHPLQPFSPRYFATPSEESANGELGGLFSYSQAMADAANALDAGGGEARSLAGVLPTSDGGFLQGRSDAALDDLCRFATAPVRFFFENRLGLTLRLGEDDVPEEEPFALDHLEAWQFKHRLLELKQVEDPCLDPKASAVLLAEGRLQQGNLGGIEYRHGAVDVAEMQAALEPLREHLDSPPLAVEVEIDGVTIVGAVAGYHAGSLAMHRVGALRPRDRIETWLRLLCASCTVDVPLRATLVSLGKEAERREMRGPSPTEAREMLACWLKAWERGWRTPLPFFPSTSWAWVAARKDPMRDASAAWTGRSYGESSDPYNRLAFPDPPFGDEFESLAVSLLRPLREAMA